MTIELSLSSYIGDIVRPLMTGEIEPEGIDLTTIIEYPPKRHRRFFRHEEFDICEVSLASYLSSRSDPDKHAFTAIPVFPEKKFRHSFLFKHVHSDISDPTDLAGKKVGIQSWETTANVWIRGILQEYYGLDLETVQWFRRKDDDVGASLPDRFDIAPIAGEQGGDAVEEPLDLKQALLSGDLDAAMDPAGEMFNAVVESETAELFFDEPIAEEKQYYADTGIHPPMHVVAIRDEVLEAHPWVAVNVFDAFVDSRDRCFERNRSPSAKTSLTWSHLHRVDQAETLGPHAWEYGLTERTRQELRTFIRYAHDQGLIPRQYDPEELFVESTLDC
ncbi:hypothetical protein [Halorubrum lipolyticum]|uniref:4,5-dihydroxyphthalate decarboxylase n=1 Tax=Halorubrum lipolyticum DSM 21995 TaxID=1227482 RepID=M0P263_9EURY|nr:hypothetical protein [Halorubrum lipolyticum]EMA62895.1 4,5-dihydroxyphthalate decarboxylase [Halorubrum lipolyticum DSM 21995]